jgi:PKD repeat protein
MRRFWLILAAVCAALIHSEGALGSSIYAEISPQWAPDTVLVGDTFNVDIYMQNTYGTMTGVSIPFVFYSPNQSISAVVHRDVHGYSPLDWFSQVRSTDSSILLLNGFGNIWSALKEFYSFSWNGALPDTVNFTGITFGGWVPDDTHKLYMSFAYRIDEAGTFCIDSCSVPNPASTFDWLFENQDVTVSFNGPYCWTVHDTTVVPNHPPVLDPIGNKQVNEGEQLAIHVTASDPDGTTPRLFVTGLPTGANFVDSGNGHGAFVWTPTFNQAGPYQVTFNATDEIDTDSEEITITVNNVNRSPILDPIGNKQVNEGEQLAIHITASDPDGTIPRLFVTGLPTGANFVDSGNGRGSFVWTPTYDQAGPYQVTFNATDEIDTDSEEITITVNNVNRSPVLDPIGNKQVNEGQQLAIHITASDPDGTIPRLFVTGLPTGANFVDSGNGRGSFVWTPTYDQAGPYQVTFNATDEIDTDSEEITITVNNVNRPPVLDQVAAGPQFVQEGDSLKLDVSASDPDGTIPFLYIQGGPASNAYFEDYGDGTGLFRFYPDIGQAGVYTVIFFASDGLLKDSELVVIQVQALSPGPCLSVAPNALEFSANYCGDSLEWNDSLHIVISNCGDGDLSWNVATEESWINYSPSEGLNFDSVAVWIDWENVEGLITEPLESGDTVYFYGTLTVTASGASNSPQYVNMTLMLYCEVEEYILTAEPAYFDYTLSLGDTLIDSFYVSEASGAQVEFYLANSQSWLLLPPAIDPEITPVSIKFAVTATGLTPGETYDDTIVVYSGADPALFEEVYIPVRLTLNAYKPVLVTIPDNFEFTVPAFDSLLNQKLFVYEESGQHLPFDAEAAEGTWLRIQPADSPGVFWQTPDTLFFDIITLGLTQDTYYDSIYIYNPSDTPLYDPVVVTVKLNVTTGQPSLVIETMPEYLEFDLYQGQVGYDSLYVYEVQGYNVPFTFSNSHGWLTVNPLGLPPYSTPTSLLAVANTSLLSPGIYTDSIVLVPTDIAAYFDTLFVPVILTVNPPIGPPGDSVWISTVPGVSGSDVIVPVYFRNLRPLEAIYLPLTWTSGDIILDEVTFDGTRVEYVDCKPIAIDNDTWHAEIAILPTFTPDVPSGRGLMAKLHFSIVQGALPAFIPLDTSSYFTGNGLMFVDDVLDVIHPTFISGGVVIDSTAGFVCGRVIDTAGNEIEGATVELWDDFPGGGLMLTDITDINGQFACHTTGISPFDAYAYKEGYYPGLVEGIQFGQIGIEIVLTPVSPVIPTIEWVDFYCDDNYYQGVPLPVGSVVDAYDPDGVHCGTYFVTVPGRYGPMPVYGDYADSPEDEGADPGDTISFFINGYPAAATGNTVWTADGDRFEVCLDIFRVEDRIIPLTNTWNLISWNVDTPTDDIAQLLASVSDCIDVVHGFEHKGLTYDPDLPDFSSLLSTDHLHGLWIRMDCPDTLVISGTPVAATTPIHVEAGWNLVSYLPNVPDTTPHALNSIYDHLIVARGFDGEGLVWDPNEDPAYSNLQHLRPGLGYWVKVTQDDVLIYPGTGPSVLFRQALGAVARLYAASQVNPSRLWMDVYSYGLKLDNELLPYGSVVEAIDAFGRVVGAATVGAEGRFGFMAVYGDDPATSEKEGLAAGDHFSLRIDGVETAESFVWRESGARLEIESPLTSLSSSRIVPDDFYLGQNFPNPFNPATTIFFSLPRTMHVTIDVYNVLGKKVSTIYDGTASAGSNSVIWNGSDQYGEPAASGVYFYRMKAGDLVMSRKMVLMK